MEQSVTKGGNKRKKWTRQLTNATDGLSGWAAAAWVWYGTIVVLVP